MRDSEVCDRTWYAMALSVKQKGVKQVPWFSLTEWHQVYQQVYSNDKTEQTKAYETLLTWQARVPKLPVGVDCTLSILQVCLRDLEWAPKINKGDLPISYENDLCLMYSTTIMRFLNHISNIGHTKQTSLFQIAKQVNIPEWIVNLRHDTAHGHELPSIGVLRIAINILLTWLHEEYWAAEAKGLEECAISNELVKEAQETEEIQEFSDLIELWTAVSLYIHAGYNFVKDIPDSELVETLQDLRSYAISLPEQDKEDTENNNDNYTEVTTANIKKDKKYKLDTARMVLLSEISRYLSKKSIPNTKDVVCDELFNSEAFLPNEDVLLIFTHKENTENELKDDILPLDMIKFWEDIMFLLYEKEVMETLIIRLIKLTENEEIDKYKRSLASLWISSIAYSFVKLDVAHCISRSLEYELEANNKRLPPKAFELKVKDETENAYPHLKYVLWFNLSDVVLPFLTDINFVSKLLLNANEFSIKFVLPILELVSPKIDANKKRLLLNLVKVYVEGQATDTESSNKNKKTFTIEDVHNLHGHEVLNVLEQNEFQNKIRSFLTDQKVRNNQWKLALAKYQWAECPVGLLPWQIDSMEMLEPLKSLSTHNVSSLESEITPGVLNTNDLKMQSQINWDNVLRKKKRLKRKRERRNADIIINRALETAKKQK
ncbi:uncharacterized protein LOC116424694 [Nomia melanderi]|uniref:uncharacterized protein LOC116424694 n=1 Tax=Nomia melanderi TaxID=2448451 RepID=UPI001304761B|nr:uncharacterized protein LOC116424694 [Nomia melanderi]